MENQILKIGLVGCGRIAHVHLATLKSNQNTQLAGACDIDPQASAAISEAYSCEAYPDLESMLKKENPAAVIICTPPDTHRLISEQALNAGCHVLCEKPLSILPEDAQSMIDCAERTGRILMMASKFRYMDDIVKARAIIRSGVLGEIILFENTFSGHVSMQNRWNSQKENSGGGVLIDNGSHSVDIVRYLLGPIEKIQAVQARQWQDIDVEDTCRIFAQCSSGASAAIDLSWSIQKEQSHFIHVYGTEGTLEIGWKGSRYFRRETSSWVDFGNGYDKFQAVGAQLQNFVDVCSSAKPPLITPEDALASVHTVQAAYRSMERTIWEPLHHE